MTEIHELTCYTCKKPIVDDESISIDHHKGGETQLISLLHLACYNEIVQYLQGQRATWDYGQTKEGMINAFQSAARGGPQIPEQAT